MAGSLSISEAARVWGVHRASVKRWIKRGAVEATKDNAGVWRIAEGQQPPPTVTAPGTAPSADLDSPSAAPGQLLNGATETSPGAMQDGSGAALLGRVAELAEALAEAGNRMTVAEKDLAVSRREVELLREVLAERDRRLNEEREQHRERVAELHGLLASGEVERVRLQGLLHAVLDRPSLLERLVRALRRPLAHDQPSSGVRERGRGRRCPSAVSGAFLVVPRLAYSAGALPPSISIRSGISASACARSRAAPVRCVATLGFIR